VIDEEGTVSFHICGTATVEAVWQGAHDA
jgi:hypothetical protein